MAADDDATLTNLYSTCRRRADRLQTITGPYSKFHGDAQVAQIESIRSRSPVLFKFVENLVTDRVAKEKKRIEADEDTANLTRWSIDQALYTEGCRESATPGVYEQILCDDETSISVQYFLDKQCTLEIKKKQVINSDTCSYLLGADDLPRGPLKFFIGDPEKPQNDTVGLITEAEKDGKVITFG